MADDRLGKYRLLSPITQGGMAEIFLALHEGPAGFEKEVVIKRVLRHLTRDQSFITMFLDEARLAARLSHPNIVQITDFGQVDDSYFLCMERLVGLDLAVILYAYEEKQRPFPAPVAAVIIAAVCDALDYAHNLTDAEGNGYGLVHRDISPSNIFLTYQGAVKVLDFGIAKARGRAIQTEAGQLKGKVHYMSPEQAKTEELDARSDLFSLGIVLYEMMTGTRPFHGDDMFQTLFAIVDGEVKPPSVHRPDIPPKMEAIILRALQVKRDDRYQSAYEVREAVLDYLATCTTVPPAVLLQNFMAELRASRGPGQTVSTRKGASSPGTSALKPKSSGGTPAPPVVERTAPFSPKEAQPHETTIEKPEPRRSPLPRWIAGGAALLLIGAAVVVLPRLRGTPAAPVASSQPAAPAPARSQHEPSQPAALPPAPTPGAPEPPAAITPKVAAVEPVRKQPAERKSETPKSVKPEPKREQPSANAGAASGLLTVGCTSDCRVYLDGKDTGRDTPAFNIRVSPGRHTVKVISTETKAEKSKDVEIIEKQLTKVSFDL